MVIQKIIYFIFELINIFLITRIVLSWIPHNRYHPIINFIYKISDPFLLPFRNMINPIGGIDFSPIIVFFLISYMHGLIIKLILNV